MYSFYSMQNTIYGDTMTNILIRTVIIYLFLILFIRFTGKRQIGELQLSELVTTLLLSEVAALPITDGDIPLLHALIPIVFLMSLEVIISYFVTKFAPLKMFFDGSPSILIRNGTIDIKELSRQRISVEELISSLRQLEKPDISSLGFVFLEPNGQLSAFDSGTDIMLPVIVDGKFNYSTLHTLELDEKDIRKMLSDRQYTPESLFLYAVSTLGKEIIIAKPS